jgi:oligopeptide transport system permease protein
MSKTPEAPGNLAAGIEKGEYVSRPNSESGWQRFQRDRTAVWSGGFLVAIAAICFLSPWIAPYSYMEQNLAASAAGPSAAHWLGTDLLGRDVLSRLMQGGMISLFVGLIATTVALLLGICYGVLAAEVGGRAEDAMMRFVDIVSTLPLTLIVILCTVVFGQNMPMIFLAVGGVSWLTMARIIRNQTRELKNSQFVQAAEALGQSRFGIFRHHHLPNLAGTIAVCATLTVPGVMLLEAFVSFLGLGVKAPMTSWGLMIKEGADIMEECPWLLISPSVVFALTLLSLNFLGDGLRDAFDPRSSRK